MAKFCVNCGNEIANGMAAQILNQQVSMVWLVQGISLG